MSDPLLKKLKLYYNKIKNPSFIVEDWVIANDELYKRHKNKLTISNINSILGDTDQYILICETKEKYLAIKYNSNFICLRQSDNEYGLVTDDYELLAINKDVLYPPKENENKKKKNITLIDLAKIFSWKLSKKTKENLKDFN